MRICNQDAMIDQIFEMQEQVMHKLSLCEQGMCEQGLCGKGLVTQVLGCGIALRGPSTA